MEIRNFYNPMEEDSFRALMEAERTRRRLGLNAARERIIEDAIRTERMLRPYREVIERVRLEDLRR